MTKAGYSCWSGAIAAPSPTTIHSVLSVIAPAQFGVDLQKIRIAFDGVTAGAVPVEIEICEFTTDGTGSANTNINQVYGQAITTGFTSKTLYTVEPTGLVVIDEGLLTPNGGVLWYDYPLGNTPDSAVSGGFAIRALAPAAVNIHCSMYFERV